MDGTVLEVIQHIHQHVSKSEVMAISRQMKNVMITIQISMMDALLAEL